jgi:hypothetical protein
MVLKGQRNQKDAFGVNGLILGHAPQDASSRLKAPTPTPPLQINARF